jgi:putative salt-induced outer membrane protein YdiY
MHFRAHALLTSLLVVGLLSVAQAAADELRLKNGDRITGDAVALLDGKLTFKTPNGELIVVWDEVASLTITRQMIVTVKGGQPELRSIEGLALGDIIAIAPPPPPLDWTGTANAGWVTTGGNSDISTLRLDGEIIAIRPRDRFSAGAAISNAEDAGETTVDNWNLAFNYDRFLTERLFINGNAIFTSDEFKSLDLRTAIGAAVGYDVWKTPRGILSVTGGLGYVNENFAEGLEDDSYTALREGVRARVFFIGRSVELFHNHDTYIGITGDDNLFFRMQNGVRFKLVAGLVSTVQSDIDYDRTPAPGRDNTDRTFALTFGYRF